LPIAVGHSRRATSAILPGRDDCQFTKTAKFWRVFSAGRTGTVAANDPFSRPPLVLVVQVTQNFADCGGPASTGFPHRICYQPLSCVRIENRGAQMPFERRELGPTLGRPGSARHPAG